jgi:hypothetical protein
VRHHNQYNTTKASLTLGLLAFGAFLRIFLRKNLNKGKNRFESAIFFLPGTDVYNTMGDKYDMGGLLFRTKNYCVLFLYYFKLEKQQILLSFQNLKSKLNQQLPIFVLSWQRAMADDRMWTVGNKNKISQHRCRNNKQTK